VPRSACETPFALWKRVDDMQASLPGKDRERVEQEVVLFLAQNMKTIWLILLLANSVFVLKSRTMSALALLVVCDEPHEFRF
jgi:hypothetical protein